MSVYILGGSTTGGGGVDNDPARAWPALLLQRRGGAAQVHFKNAIEPSYFLHCAERFAPNNSVPVAASVLDLGPNLWSPNAVLSLQRLVTQTRLLTRAPRVGLVGWGCRASLKHDLSKLRAVSDATGAAVLLPAVRSYADEVHPDADAHAAIARAVDDFVDGALGGAVDPNASWRPPRERCFEAAQIPHIGRGWPLIAYGPQRGKRGLRPEEGTPLRIRAAPLPQACGVVVTLGYLRTERPGTLSVACSGACECSEVRGFWQRAINPYPEIATALTRPLRVTGSSSFWMAQNQSCTVRLAGYGDTMLTGFYLRAFDADDVHNAAISAKPAHRRLVDACNGFLN